MHHLTLPIPRSNVLVNTLISSHQLGETQQQWRLQDETRTWFWIFFCWIAFQIFYAWRVEVANCFSLEIKYQIRFDRFEIWAGRKTERTLTSRENLDIIRQVLPHRTPWARVAFTPGLAISSAASTKQLWSIIHSGWRDEQHLSVSVIGLCNKLSIDSRARGVLI